MRPALPQDDLDRVLALTPAFWLQFGGARVFMTGGTGFVGAWLLEVMQHANHKLGARMEVVVLSRNPEQARARAPHLFGDPSISLLEGDVSRFSSPIGKFDLCIHAAIDVGDSDKAKNHRAIFDASVCGTRRVLDLAANSGARRFLLTSSGAVYGTQPPTLERLPESFNGAPDPLDITAAYGNGKRAAEWLTCEASGRSGLDASIARIFALLGPGLPLEGPFAAGNFIRDALKGQPIQVQGDGLPVRSYLYMLDACVWLLKILMAGKSGQAYNVGSEDAVSVAELAQHVVDAVGKPHSIQVARPAQAGSGNAYPPRYVPDTAKARDTLSLEQYTPLTTALQKTIEWSRAAMQT